MIVGSFELLMAWRAGAGDADHRPPAAVAEGRVSPCRGVTHAPAAPFVPPGGRSGDRGRPPAGARGTPGRADWAMLPWIGPGGDSVLSSDDAERRSTVSYEELQ